MKKIVFKFFFAVTMVALLSSCAAVHWGYMNASASLSSGNFSYQATNVKGEATATYIFGIGGLARETLVSDAKQNMLQLHPLKDNQALANLTVNFKVSTYFGVYSTETCTVTADVVQFK